jgi:hypothetical protein
LERTAEGKWWKGKTKSLDLQGGKNSHRRIEETEVPKLPELSAPRDINECFFR